MGRFTEGPYNNQSHRHRLPIYQYYCDPDQYKQPDHHSDPDKLGHINKHEYRQWHNQLQLYQYTDKHEHEQWKEVKPIE